jgi:hypothetical protein
LRPSLRWLRRIALGLFAVVLLAGGYLVYEIGPSNLWGMLLYDQREEGLLQVGELAPDVTLVSVDDGGPVQLHERTGAGKPTVLVFGSFT